MKIDLKKIIFTAVLLLSFIYTCFGAEDLNQTRAVLQNNGPAIVVVRFAIKLTFGKDQPIEMKNDVIGVVIASIGTTLVSLDATDPSRRTNAIFGGESSDTQTEITSCTIKLVDGTDIPAKVFAKNNGLNIAFLKPINQLEKPITSVDLNSAVKVDILEPVLVISRLGSIGNRAINARFDRIQSVVDKPKRFYVASLLETTMEIGSPVFTLDGKLVGFIYYRFIQPSAADQMSPTESMPGQGMIAAITPAQEIIDAYQSISGEKPTETAPAKPGEIIIVPVDNDNSENKPK